MAFLDSDSIYQPGALGLLSPLARMLGLGAGSPAASPPPPAAPAPAAPAIAPPAAIPPGAAAGDPVIDPNRSTRGTHDPPAGPAPTADPAMLSGLGIDTSKIALPNMSDFTLGLQNKTGTDFLFKDQGSLDDFLKTDAEQRQSQAINTAMLPGETALMKQTDKGQSFFGGLTQGLPLIAAVLSMNPAIGAALMGALGLGGGALGLSAGMLGTGLINAGAGAAAGASHGGLTGALEGALGGGLGSIGGSALGNLLGGALGGAGSLAGAGSAAGDVGALGGVAGAAGGAGGSIGGSLPGTLLSDLTLTGASPLTSLLSDLGGSLGGAGGGINLSGTGAPETPQVGGIPDPFAGSPFTPTTLPGAPDASKPPGTELSPLTVTAPDPGAGVNPLSVLGNIPGLVDTPKVIADDASKLTQPNDKSLGKTVDDFLKKVIGQFGPGAPSLPGVPNLPVPDIFGGPSTPAPASPGATPTGNPGGNPDPFTPPPSNPGSGPGGPVSPVLPSLGSPSVAKPATQGSAFGSGGGGVGPAGLGAINVKGSAAPDIYPWSTVV